MTAEVALWFRNRCRTTIEDFVKSYFPLHGLNPLQDIFEYLDIIVYVEATIYQMDEDNEKLCGQGVQDEQHVLEGESAILEVLKQRGLNDPRLTAELAKGKQYWADERRLCKSMLDAQADSRQQLEFDVEDVHSTSEGKSFDYRVLNLLLFRLTKRPYDEQLLEFLFIDEHLVDMGDDLVDYEPLSPLHNRMRMQDDVIANSFNIYRAYIQLYGRDAQLHLVQRIAHFEQQHDTLLKQLPVNVQQLVRARQKEASSVAGSEKWVFPAPILDEARFRDAMADVTDDSF